MPNARKTQENQYHVDTEILLLHCHKPFPVLLGEPMFQKAVNKLMGESEKILEPYRRIWDRFC